jgi:hypothetical protein
MVNFAKHSFKGVMRVLKIQKKIDKCNLQLEPGFRGFSLEEAISCITSSTSRML